MENKKVFVTGGNRGIGKGIVEGFLDNGNQVLASCRDASKFPFKNDKLTVAELDISDAKSVENFKKFVDDLKYKTHSMEINVRNYESCIEKITQMIKDKQKGK